MFETGQWSTLSGDLQESHPNISGSSKTKKLFSRQRSTLNSRQMFRIQYVNNSIITNGTSYLMILFSFDVDDKSHTTSVFLEFCTVQTDIFLAAIIICVKTHFNGKMLSPTFSEWKSFVICQILTLRSFFKLRMPSCTWLFVINDPWKRTAVNTCFGLPPVVKWSTWLQVQSSP